jgi:hypothetical protein
MGKKKATRALKLESLEKRELMAADFSNGVLTVTGTSGDDTIALWNAGDKLAISRNNQPVWYSQIPIRQIKTINANLGAGRDELAINQNGWINDHWNVNSLNVNLGSGGNGQGFESVNFQGQSARNVNIRGSSTQRTSVRLAANLVDNAMIDLGRQQSDDLVDLRLQRAGTVDIRTYDGNDIVNVGHWDYFGAPAMNVNRLNVNTGNGHDVVNLRGGTINNATIQTGSGNDRVDIDPWVTTTIHSGVIDGGTNDSFGDELGNRRQLRGGVVVRGMERGLR